MSPRKKQRRFSNVHYDVLQLKCHVLSFTFACDFASFYLHWAVQTDVCFEVRRFVHLSCRDLVFVIYFIFCNIDLMPLSSAG